MDSSSTFRHFVSSTFADPSEERNASQRRVRPELTKLCERDGHRTTKKPWSALRDDFRESNRVAADHLIIKLAALGLKLCRSNELPTEPVEFDHITKEQAQLLDEMEHNRWVAERLLAGWRYAPEGQSIEVTQANKKRKLSHNIIPWDYLGQDRKKDFDQLKTVLKECQNDRFCLEIMPATEVHLIRTTADELT